MAHNVVCQYCGNPAVCRDLTETYPHRSDLAGLYNWHCDPCDARVGCHKKGAYTWVNGKKVTSDGKLPFGTLANETVRNLRQEAHACFDPLWTDPRSRKHEYRKMALMLKIPEDLCHISMMDETQLNACIEYCNSLTTNL